MVLHTLNVIDVVRGWGARLIVETIVLAAIVEIVIMLVLERIDIGLWAVVLDPLILGLVLGPLVVWRFRRQTIGLKQYELALHQIESFQAVLDEHALYSVTDTSGKIIEVNPGFCRISGYSREELLGRDHRLVNSGHHPKSFWAEMWKTIASGEVWRGQVCNRAKDGTLFWVQTTNIPQFDKDGRIDRYISLRIDITEQRLVEERLALAMRAATIGLWDWDIESGETYFSDTFYTMLGYEAGEFPMCVDTWQSLRHQDDLFAAMEDVQRHFDGETGVYSNEHRLKQKDGDWLWIRDIGEVVERDKRGEAKRMIGVHIDIQEMREALDQAQGASNAKSEFLANMSHEIRTPMTAILGYADLLVEEKEGGLSPERLSDAVGTIRRNGEHLLSIINDILDVSKIEAGKMEVEEVECSVVELVESVRSLMTVRAEAKGVQLDVVFETELPERVRTDPTRLRQILVNLVGNAIKFTEQGGVTLRVGVDDSAGDATMLRVDVVDTGIGMTWVQTQRLFGAFAQADASTSRRFGGTGLGLLISKRLAELLGGSIDVVSEIGEGSTFTARVRANEIEGAPRLTPAACWEAFEQRRQAQAQQKKLDNSSKRLLAGLRILLAEDGPDNQKLIAFHLKKAGAEVEIAENGKLAVEAVRREAEGGAGFDMVLMDMQMPELDGYGAARLLREEGYGLAVVALTAHAMAGDRERCLEAGCDDYLTKPIDRKMLIETCGAWGRRGQRSRAAA